MDKRISRPVSLIFDFDVSGMDEAQVQAFRTHLVWHLKGQMEVTMRPLEFDTEVHREVDTIRDGSEPICGSADEGGPLDWICRRVPGHDDPEEDGGHLRGWAAPDGRVW